MASSAALHSLSWTRYAQTWIMNSYVAGLSSFSCFVLSELLYSLCCSGVAVKECFSHRLFKRTLGYANLVAPWLIFYHCKVWGGCPCVPPLVLFPQTNS